MPITEGYLKVPIRMGVVNQARQSCVKGTVPPFHYPITFRVITGGVDPLDPQHLAGLAEKRGHESAALVSNQDRTRAVSSDNFSSIYSFTDFHRLIWYSAYLEKWSTNVSKYLLRRSVNGYGPVMSIEVI